jgi:malate dehydrogenase (oxaloacetate-decarboxylating)(NADP+)
MNGLEVVGKPLDQVKLVTSGAGAAALACLDLLVRLGLRMENITVTDIAGVVYRGRKEEMDPLKERYAKVTNLRKLSEAVKGADVFLGLSAPRVLKPEWLETMADRPIVMALANPTPEILPEEVRAVRPDAIIATGRSDYPNQVNNVLCFPFIFRGALDVGATTINDAMEVACVKAIADLAQAEIPDEVTHAYGDDVPSFGPDYLIPRPFDRRSLVAIAPAVAKAAMDSGVATRPIPDLKAYHDRLNQFVFRSGLLMKPMFDRARQARKRVCYAEGEEEKVLQAAQTVVDEGLAVPILIGRRAVVLNRIKRLGLRIMPGKDVELVDPDDDHRFREYWTLYHSLTERKGVTQTSAQTVVRTRTTVIGALMVRRGEADALICGKVGRFIRHLSHLLDVVGLAPGVSHAYALTALILPTGTFFLGDTHVTPEPTAAQIAEFATLAARAVPKFGIIPKAALLSHSNFGTRDTPTAKLMRAALELIRERAPDLEVEGEMHGDAAINEQIRMRLFPNSRLQGQANLLIMPTLDAANISFNLLKTLGNGLSVGPMLMGVAMPVHVVVPSITVRGNVNRTAVAAVDAQTAAQGQEATRP